MDAMLTEPEIASPSYPNPDTKVCAVCGAEKRKTTFAKPEDWESPDKPKCQACRTRQQLHIPIGVNVPAAQGKMSQFLTPLTKPTTAELIDLHDEVLVRSLQAFSKKKLDESSAKDLAIVAKNILMNKQLLEEKPTQIVASSDREHMRKLLEMVREEKARKAKTINVTPMEVPT